MSDERQDRLKDMLEELKTWPYERLAALRSERLSREVVLKSGRHATVHAEALEEYDENGVKKLLIPVELWLNDDVVWLHLIARSDNAHETSLELHTNPR